MNKFSFSLMARINCALEGTCVCIRSSSTSYMQYFVGKKMEWAG